MTKEQKLEREIMDTVTGLTNSLLKLNSLDPTIARKVLKAVMEYIPEKCQEIKQK